MAHVRLSHFLPLPLPRSFPSLCLAPSLAPTGADPRSRTSRLRDSARLLGGSATVTVTNCDRAVTFP